MEKVFDFAEDRIKLLATEPEKSKLTRPQLQDDVEFLKKAQEDLEYYQMKVGTGKSEAAFSRSNDNQAAKTLAWTPRGG